MPTKTNRIILLLISVSAFAFCIWRDIQLEKQYPGDLRNRIVGARLQNDGRLPYFYKWKSQDGLRYYDPQNFDTLKVSNITATPFFHQLISPLAEKPQRSVSIIWLITEYCLLALTVILAFSFAKKKLQRLAITGITLLVLLTSAWKVHIAAGQYYILVPGLFMLFYYFISRKKFLLHAIIAGILSVSIILIRPNTILFFVPFLFLWNNHPRRYKIVFIVAGLTLLSFVFVNKENRMLWNDFRHAMSEQFKAHQGQPATQKNMPDPRITNWEGINTHQVTKESKEHPFHFESEHGNLFVIIKHLFSAQPPAWFSGFVTLLLVSLLSISFYKKNVKNKTPSLFIIALFGSCLYMVSDLCSPFYRFQYNTTQWVFPLLLTAAYYHRRYIKIIILLFIGLLLSIIEIRAIPIEHTIGEYCMFIGLLLLAFRYTPASRLEKTVHLTP